MKIATSKIRTSLHNVSFKKSVLYSFFFFAVFFADLYEINLRRCRERLATADKRSRIDSAASLSREQSVENIHLDVLRTFPTLGFFQEVSAWASIIIISLNGYQDCTYEIRMTPHFVHT